MNEEKKNLKTIYKLNFISGALCLLGGVFFALSENIAIGSLFACTGLLEVILGFLNKKKWEES